MARANNIFTTIRTEGALLPADLLQRISEEQDVQGLTAHSYHRPGEKLNEVINRSWNALQGVWASFRAAQERLPEDDLGTTLTRERWLLPLFRELDYGRLQTATAVEIDGRTYPISHGWEHVPIHLVSFRVGLDERRRGAAGASTASPHSLLQIFLNRSDDHLWGFVSNGHRLRILRDSMTLTRQAYVEFDLEAMMEGEVYSDFVLLWLLCHQSRVEGEKPSDCWLEKWMKFAEDQGTRALDQLRDGVEQAIEALGLGFLEHHTNADLRDQLTSGELSAQDYYRQLLRMVYRLLFLFVAEDRDLLLNPDAPQDARERYVNYYSTQRLRRMAERYKGTRHPDLFESLRLVMRLLSGDSAPTPGPSPSGGWEKQVSPHEGERFREGAAGLGLIPLGSFLFSDRAVTDIIDCQISNLHLLTAVRALSLTYDQRAQVYRTVDYKNLGSDELGSIFESLLELHPQINVPARHFALATAAGNERKTTGSYYTPESLVHALLDSALDPVLEEAIKPSPPKSPSPSGRGGLTHTSEQDAVWRARASEAMQQIAKDLRQRQTPTEEIMWEALRDRRLDGLKFRRQHAIANTAYVADFLCYEVRLIIEIDGGIHEKQRKQDAIRQQNIEAEGYTVHRFTNEQIYTDLESVLTTILATVRANSPLPEGEGPGVRVPTTPEQRILALKICDPACGSGHFLIAAANRMAKALATVRTGEEEPPPAAIQEAKRDIISHCIYGVDINPMAVELCKVNLWMEALEPGKPLNFLDHRIQVGNSLLGTTPRLMADGIPDDAFKPIEGDDPKYAASMRKVNREERKQRAAGIRQLGLFDAAPAADYAYLTEAMHALDATPDNTLDAVRRKEAQYAALASDREYVKARLLADAWCAAFVWEKRQNGLPMPMTDLLYRRMEDDPLAENLQAVRETIVELTDRYQFFHWHVAFPDVFSVSEDMQHAQNEQTGWHGGFDCVLGNPPWENIKIQEKEWFAEKHPQIANAANAARRREMIERLAVEVPHIYGEFLADKRAADGQSHFYRVSGRYPLCGRGDINTYAIFAELNRSIVNSLGLMGAVLPSGIATGNTTRFFLQDLLETRSLRSFFDFENRKGIFPGVQGNVKFCLLTLSLEPSADFMMAAQLDDPSLLLDTNRIYRLSADEVRVINPNTMNCPTFSDAADARIVKRVHREIPIFIREDATPHNFWEAELSIMFHMSNDSSLFLTLEDINSQSGQFNAEFDYVPLYEAKFAHQYNHRIATFEGIPKEQRFKIHAGTSSYSVADWIDPYRLVLPRYWVKAQNVIDKNASSVNWLVSFRKAISAVADSRSLVTTIIPHVGVGDSLSLISCSDPSLLPVLVANLNSFQLDYVTRQKSSGGNLNFFILKQLPVIPPHTYTPALLDFIVPRVLELTYTAWDLAAFAADVGYDGPPFIWDEERRFLMRCELDALYFHLYQISRDDVDYIMETFPIVKRKDEARHGEYLTKWVILEMYDQMADLSLTPVPSPKGRGGNEGTYLVPDVGEWVTWLSPGPASPDVAHPDRRD